MAPLVSGATCRSCRGSNLEEVISLGDQPLANRLPLFGADVNVDRYPLRLCVCAECWLLQVDHAIPADVVFSDYTYFSSTSTQWLDHARAFQEWAVDRFSLSQKSTIIEVASNDGYLLNFFKQAGMRVIGIEPAAPVAERSIALGIDTLVEFLDSSTVGSLPIPAKADLLIANNVIAHVPDILDFVQSLTSLLAPDGAVSIEIPYCANLIRNVQFDTIYHEHFSYMSLHPLDLVFRKAGLSLDDVHFLATHGGSMRLIARHAAAARRSPLVDDLLARETQMGLARMDTYTEFGNRVGQAKVSIWQTLTTALDHNHTVAGFGAPAKASTLLNYCDIGPDTLPFTVDSAPSKQGRLIPGVSVPILPPESLFERWPDTVWIFPWNIADEIRASLRTHGFSGRLMLTQPAIGIEGAH